jgi:signal transduction histidine kinase
MVTHPGEPDAHLDEDALRLHALKNCAATISILSRLLARGSEVDRAYLDRLEAAAGRMNELLCASLEARSLVRARALDVSDLLRFVRTEAEPKAQESHVDLLFSHDPASVRGSERDLGEALLNLVHNAIEATPPGGHVHVVHRADRAGAHQFVISDEGPGMSAELTRVAGRRPVRSSKCGGSGVGLVLARRVVENRGGHMDVRSSTRGTTVRVMLPAA